MGEAFEICWRVLKSPTRFQDIQTTLPEMNELGHGATRTVHTHPSLPDKVIKLPKHSAWFDRQAHDLETNAAMNALAQMGYPVIPEKPVIVPARMESGNDYPNQVIRKLPELGMIQDFAGETVKDRTEDKHIPRVQVRPSLLNTAGRELMNNDSPSEMSLDEVRAFRNRKRQFNDELLERDLPNFLALGDLHSGNIVGAGTDEEPFQIIDGHAAIPRINHALGRYARLWRETDPVKRATFKNLFSDKSQFADIANYHNNPHPTEPERMPPLTADELGTDKMDEAENEGRSFIEYGEGRYKTPMDRAHDEYSKYLASKRRLELIDSLVADPHQTRVEEWNNPYYDMSVSDLGVQGFYGDDNIHPQLRDLEVGSSLSNARRELLPPDTFTGTNLRFKDPNFWQHKKMIEESLKNPQQWAGGYENEENNNQRQNPFER